MKKEKTIFSVKCNNCNKNIENIKYQLDKNNIKFYYKCNNCNTNITLSQELFDDEILMDPDDIEITPEERLNEIAKRLRKTIEKKIDESGKNWNDEVRESIINFTSSIVIKICNIEEMM